MSKQRKWTDDQLVDEVASVYSMRQLIKNLGLSATGGNYKSIAQHIERLKISTDHWTGQGWRKNSSTPVRSARTLKEIMISDSDYSSSKLSARLTDGAIIPYHCAICQHTGEWNGAPLRLRLDHINGINNDHRKENLRFLCPNCDSQTDTFCGRNIGRYSRRDSNP